MARRLWSLKPWNKLARSCVEVITYHLPHICPSADVSGTVQHEADNRASTPTSWAGAAPRSAGVISGRPGVLGLVSCPTNDVRGDLIYGARIVRWSGAAESTAPRPGTRGS